MYILIIKKKQNPACIVCKYDINWIRFFITKNEYKCTYKLYKLTYVLLRIDSHNIGTYNKASWYNIIYNYIQSDSPSMITTTFSLIIHFFIFWVYIPKYLDIFITFKNKFHVTIPTPVFWMIITYLRVCTNFRFVSCTQHN